MRAPLRRALRYAVASLAAAGLAAGCGGDASAPAGPAPAMPATDAPATSATLHFLDASGRLVTERRPVAGALTVPAALTALAEGPRTPGLAPALPAGATLLGAPVRAGTATADFSAAFESAYPPGGAAAELAVLAPIVYTATGVPGVRRVRITVEGRSPQPTGSQVDLSRPLTRADLPVTVVRGR